METHSEKGLKTLTLLGTTPSDWGLVEIIWKREKVMVPMKVRCPTCYGIGEAHFELNGSLALNKIDSKNDFYKWNDRQREIRALPKNTCPTCPPMRGWRRHYGTGEITVMKEREVWVGYVQWELKTVFDSRFVIRDGRVCQLCSKTIKSVWSGLVPVHGKDTKGQIHGMWVGEDCARKFLGIKKWKKDKDSVLALDK
jgi:hypothetical protein